MDRKALGFTNVTPGSQGPSPEVIMSDTHISQNAIPEITPEAIDAGIRTARRLRSEAVHASLSAFFAALRQLFSRPATPRRNMPQPLPLRHAL